MKIRLCLRYLSAVSVATLLSSAAWADAALSNRESQISLRSGVIDTLASKQEVPEHLQVGANDGSSDYVLVKYPAPVSAAQRQALEAATEQIYTYLPHFAYLVKMPSGFVAEAAKSSLGASWIGPYHPAYKMSPSISSAVPAAKEDDTALQVMIHTYPDADLSNVVAKIRGLGISDVAGAGEASRFGRVRLLLSADDVVRHREALARFPEVFWIDTEGRRVLLNDTTIWVGQTGLDGGQMTTVFDHGLYGEGQIVAVLDTGIDPDMCYFRDADAGTTAINLCDGGTAVDLDQRKLIAVNFLWDGDCDGGVANADEWDNHDHGSHVAGTVAGDDFNGILTHDTGDGMAPGARLIVQDGGFSGSDNCADLPGLGCPVVDLVPLFQQTYDQGARIHTNSWGDQENAGSPQSYSAGSQDSDQFMWDNKDFLLVFAAGNNGPGGTVLSPSIAKSVLAVGATQRATDAETLAGFSSCGPTFDGRIKPEITVPGQSISSANSDNNSGSNNCNQRTMSGTSMAAPAAAGLAALARQYFEDGWYPSGTAVAEDGFTPSGALLRAVLANSGRPMTNAPSFSPGDCQGWGRILLEDALYFDGDERRLWVVEDEGFEMGSSGEVRQWDLEVSDSTVPLEISLAWTDFPSTPAADPTINNDLDLEVRSPEGLTYKGNVYFMGDSSIGGTLDRVNTLEQVLFLEPMTGTYTVTVRSFNVPDGPQPFSVLATGAMAVSSAIFTDGFESGNTSVWSSATP